MRFKHRLIAKPLTYFIALCLLLNAGISAAVSAHNMAYLQANAKQDSMLVCTGKAVKWISASHYFETGEFLELSNTSAQADDEAQEQAHYKCVLSVLVDKPNAIDKVFDLAVSISIERNVAVVPKTISLSQASVFDTLARAPPYS